MLQAGPAARNEPRRFNLPNGQQTRLGRESGSNRAAPLPWWVWPRRWFKSCKWMPWFNQSYWKTRDSMLQN